MHNHQRPAKPLTTITASEVQTHSGQVIRRVAKHQEHLLVERAGLPVVVLLPVADYLALTNQDNLPTVPPAPQPARR